MKNLKKFWPFLIILAVTVWVLGDFWTHSGVPITHDADSHLARIAGFHLNFLDGNFFPRWLPNIMYGLGHPVMIFIAPLPYYFPTLFTFFGFSLILAYKISTTIVYLFSGFLMFLWLKNLFKNSSAALLGSLIFLLTPYRIVDIYARGAYAENFAFLFVPLVGLAFFLFHEKTTRLRFLFLIVSIIGLGLSHAVFLLIFAPFFFLYAIAIPQFLACYTPDVCRRRNTTSGVLPARFSSIISHHRQFLLLLIAIILSFGLMAYIYLPMILESKYTHLDYRGWTSANQTQFLSLPKMLLPQWGNINTLLPETIRPMSYQSGLAVWFVLIIAAFFVVKNIFHLSQFFKKNPFVFVGLSSALLALFFMLPISNFLYEKIFLLSQIQFPWRFQALFLTSISLAGASLFIVLNRRPRLILLLVVCCLLLINIAQNIKGTRYYEKPDNYYFQNYPDSTQGIESLPIWAVFEYSVPGRKIALYSGQGEITKLQQHSFWHSYEVSANTPLKIIDFTLYFPGWKVLIDNQETIINYQDQNYRGLLTYEVPQGNHQILVKFTETKTRMVANFISISSFLTLLTILYFYHKRSRFKI